MYDEVVEAIKALQVAYCSHTTACIRSIYIGPVPANVDG